jgi:Domain of Unknown Function (DUF1206)
MTSMAQSARRTAGRARNSSVLEALTRGGFVGYGLLHLAVAWLALQIAFRRAGQEGSQSGAFQLLSHQPLGRPLLVVIAVGLLAMAVWQLLEAAIGNRDVTGGRRVAERVFSAGRTVIYAALAWTAWKVQSGAPTSSAGQQRQATAGVLAQPAGRVLVVLAALLVIGVGIGLVVYGAKRMFVRRLYTGRMSYSTRRLVVGLGRVGYIAKGVAFGIAGLLAFAAAVKKDAGTSTGLDGALHTLAGKPYGQVLLVAVAAGFAAFGVYCFFQSRYRKV